MQYPNVTCPIVGLHCPTDDAPGEQIVDGGTIEPAFGGPDVSEVGDPLLVSHPRQQCPVPMLQFMSEFSGFQHLDHCDSQEVFLRAVGSNRGVSVELQILFLIQLLDP